MILLLSAAVSAHAEKWVSAGETLDGKDKYFVDVSSIRIAGDLRQAWVKTVFAPHSNWNVRVRDGRETKIWIDYQLAHEVYNCADHVFRQESLSLHLEEGISQKIPPEVLGAQWRPIEPATTAAVIFDFICD